jgi:hypothetical protein
VIRPRPITRERAQCSDESDRRPSPCSDLDVEQRGADRQGEDRHRKPVDDDGECTAEEQRQPPRRRDEDEAERLLVALAGDGLGHREQARDRGVLQGVADHVEPVRLERGRPADVREEQDLEDRGNE